MDKKELRKIALEKRAKINQTGKAPEIARLFLAVVQLPQKSNIAVYVPTKAELDVSCLFAIFEDLGHRLCLPRIAAEAQEMTFHEYKIGDELQPNKFGIAEPLPSAKQVQPNVVLVPMLAFDRSKNRLGYGSGYYDRYLAAHPALKIGVAFAEQEIEQIPCELHDVKLDIIVTDEFVL